MLVLAGSSSQPVGEYENSMQLLETGLFDQMGISRIGVAGHPEGSPDISARALEDALKWKNQLAQRTDAEMYLVTQFCFEAKAVIEWENQLAELGNKLPVHIGIPGVATIGTLLKHAAACGIGPSMNFLKKQARSARKLLQNSTPEQLLCDIAQHRTWNSDTMIEKLHVYPLGGLRKSAEWLERFQSEAETRSKSVA